MDDLVKALKLLEALRSLRRPKGPPLREADIVAGSTMPHPRQVKLTHPKPEAEPDDFDMEISGLEQFASTRGKAGRRPGAAISMRHPAVLPQRVTEHEIASNPVAPFPQHKPAVVPMAARRPVQMLRAVGKSEDELGAKRQQKQRVDREQYLSGNWGKFNTHDWGADAAAGLTHQDAMEAMPPGKKVVWTGPMPSNDESRHVLDQRQRRERALAPGSREWLAGLIKP